MKTTFAILLFAAIFCFSHEIMSETVLKKDSLISVDSALKDSIKISDLVKGQIEAAQAGGIKSGMNYQLTEEVKPEPKKKKTAGKVKDEKSGFFEELVLNMKAFNGKYLNVVILTAASILILGFVFGKRFIKNIGMPGKRLKNSINLIRAERPVTLKNKKLNLVRSKLSDTKDIYNITEENISGKARNMSVGKGELYLAAKVKAFQLSKISK